LAYLPSSNGLGFMKTNASGNCEMYGHKFGSLPSQFSASPNSCTPTTWSFYAALTLASGGGGIVSGGCGSSNGADLTSAPTANLCSAGTASSVSGSGPWNWTCAGSGGGTTASCSALLEISGACGSANGVTASTAPTANLCSAGTASTVAGSGPWSWSCAGSNGGATALCSDSLKSSAGGSGGSGGVLPSDRDASANWKMAGMLSVGGIPNRTTQCGPTVNPRGGGLDDTANIQAAIEACPTGQVVQLGAGTFTVGSGN